MASNSKWLKEKIYKVKEPTTPADPAVLARQSIHEAVAKWVSKWEKPIDAMFSFAAFLTVLLPAIAESWRKIITNLPSIEWIFYNFSNLTTRMRVITLVVVFTGFLLRALGSKYPEGWDHHKFGGFPSFGRIVEWGMYPRTRGEEVTFWFCAVRPIPMGLLWFLGFGVIAFFINN